MQETNTNTEQIKVMCIHTLPYQTSTNLEALSYLQWGQNYTVAEMVYDKKGLLIGYKLKELQPLYKGVYYCDRFVQVDKNAKCEIELAMQTRIDQQKIENDINAFLDVSAIAVAFLVVSWVALRNLSGRPSKPQKIA